jgi:hypothetical protein
MEDRSNIPQKWFSPGTRVETSSGSLQFDVLFRWNERTSLNAEKETEYIYDAQRIDVLAPEGENPEKYLESIKADLLLKASGGKRIAIGEIKSEYIQAVSTRFFKKSVVDVEFPVRE